MKAVALVLAAVCLAACAAKPPAPVVELSERRATTRVAERGEYTVRRGDTLHAIAFSFGLDHRDLARWNGVASPYLIYPDQRLRLTAPATSPSRRTAPEPVGAESGAPAVRPAERPAVEADAAPSRPVRNAPAGPAEDAVASVDPRRWRWPVQGRLLRTFAASDPARSGLDIAGAEGQPVLAAAPGTVVYSGNGLLGYGELIIIKHSERMLSAYAHNRLRTVVEGDFVEAGQKIAELGRNDRNEQLLHFEIRVNGRPVDPLNYLPRR